MNKILICLLLSFGTHSCLALRCHGKLVYEGDTQQTVSNKCGEPKAQEILTTSRALFNSEGVQYGAAPFLKEVWTFQSSPQDFEYKVYFTDKVVTSITANRN